MTTIHVQRRGRLGNWMFQYMLARTLQTMVPDAQITGISIPEWGIETPAVPPPGGATAESRRGHRVRLPVLAALLRSGQADTVVLRSFGMRMEHIVLARQAYREMFISAAPNVTFDDGFVVINVRAAEILNGVHPDYIPLPIPFYESLLSEGNRRPVFVGQTYGDHPYLSSLRDAFPDAIFVGQQSAVDDFRMVMGARHVVLAVSSFSWLAGWFSEAKTVVMPLAGLFDPRRRPDVDLLPRNDPRYSFKEVPLESQA